MLTLLFVILLKGVGKGGNLRKIFLIKEGGDQLVDLQKQQIS
jgi:hypothetical protein